jgi:hypothetical protein
VHKLGTSVTGKRNFQGVMKEEERPFDRGPFNVWADPIILYYIVFMLNVLLGINAMK